jgi:hypothetical protein
MGSRYDTSAETFRRELRIREAAERGVRQQYPVLSELVEHATRDLTTFEMLQDNLPPDIAEALTDARAALNGLATVLERHKPQAKPEG